MHVHGKEGVEVHRRRRRRLVVPIAASLALTLGLAACGDDDDDATTTTTEADSPSTTRASTTTTEATNGAASGETVEITGVDYAYEGVPETVETGTQLTFTNASEGEVHELILVRIDDDETRPLDELVGLGDAAQDVVEDVGVAVALPGQDGMVVDGDLTLTEPGRYAMLCFIPTGADPAAYEEAIANPPTDGPPDIPGGAPHVANGMYAELIVE